MCETETLRSAVLARQIALPRARHFLRKRSSRTTSPPPADLSVGFGLSGGFSIRWSDVAVSGLAGVGTARTAGVGGRALTCGALTRSLPPPPPSLPPFRGSGGGGALFPSAPLAATPPRPQCPPHPP